MLTSDQIIPALQRKIIPVLQLHNANDAFWTAQQLIASGITTMELSFHTTDVLDVLYRLAPLIYDHNVCVGMSGIINLPLAHFAFSSDMVHYVASPCWVDGLVELSHTYHKPWLCGAMTPTEINLAYQEGVRHIRLFPFAPANAMATLKEYHALFKDVYFIPQGQFSAQEQDLYWASGAHAIAETQGLTPTEQELYQRDAQGYQERIKQFGHVVRSNYYF